MSKKTTSKSSEVNYTPTKEVYYQTHIPKVNPEGKDFTFKNPPPPPPKKK